jgi:hypothetical protein
LADCGVEQLSNAWLLRRLDQSKIVVAAFRRLIVYVFLRLYGRALGRSRRGDRESAYNDAVTQTAISMALIVTSSSWVVFAAALPALFPRHFAKDDLVLIVPTLAIGNGIIYWIQSCLKDTNCDPKRRIFTAGQVAEN